MSTYPTHFAHQTFSQSHVQQYDGVTPVISYSSDSYKDSTSSGFVNYTDNYVFDNSVSGKHFFVSSPTEKEQVYFNGVCISRATGYSFSYEGLQYETCCVGDINGDAFIDAQDLAAAVNYVLSGAVINSASTKSTDICTDGVLDVLDISCVERLVNGHISTISVA